MIKMKYNFSRLMSNFSKDRVAVEYGKEKITYSEIWNCVNSYYDVIKDNQDTNIGIYIDNEPEYVIAYLLLLFAGKTIVPIYTGIKGKELENLLEYTDVKLIISTKQHRNIFEQLPKSFSVVFIDRNKRLKQELFPLNKMKKSSSDVMLLLQTSGTTSNPKRVMLTYDNILNNVNSNIESLELEEEDRTLIILPIVFGYCNNVQLLSHLMLGGTLIFTSNDISLYPQKLLKFCEENGVTNTVLTPNLIYQLSNLSYKCFTRSLKKVFFGGGRTSKEVIDKLLNLFPTVEFVQTYGLTECSPRVTSLFTKQEKNKIGSVGKTIDGVSVKISKYNNEVLVKGKNVMAGYYKNPNLTKKVITKDGWLKTGDIGYMDCEGYLYISGRIKNVIINGGLNVLAEEVESVILTNDHVSDCCVYGESNARLGEIICAKIVRKNQISVKDIKDFCNKRLTAYKVPHKIIFVESLEKTYNGKIKR